MVANELKICTILPQNLVHAVIFSLLFFFPSHILSLFFFISQDVTLYRAPDCSARTCPSGRAWADVPLTSLAAHALSECSNRGTCDRATGECSCFAGFTGSACQRTSCPNDCSGFDSSSIVLSSLFCIHFFSPCIFYVGHGVCVSIKQMAQMANALPLAPDTYYEGDEVRGR